METLENYAMSLEIRQMVLVVGKESQALAKDIKNIVLMCPACHKIIDSDTEAYTIEIVEGMKKRHEDRIRLVTSIARQEESCSYVL